MKNTRRIQAIFLRIALIVLSPWTAFAQNSDRTVPGLVRPEPKLLIRPHMPSDPSSDGWALFRYTILANGRVTDIERIDGFEGSLFGTATRDALTRWIYKPATINGNPVPFYNQKYAFVFILPTGKMPTEQPKYKAVADEIRALIDSHNFADAKARATTEIAKTTEIPKYVDLNILKAHAELGLGKEAAAVNDLEAVKLLPVKEFIPALRELFALEAKLGQMANALDTYEKMKRLQSELLEIKDRSVTVISASEQTHLAELQQALAGQPLQVSGAISNGRWAYMPLGHSFILTGVDGTLTSLTARCHLLPPTAIATPTAAKAELPSNGGECELEFSGADDTDIHLTEFFNPRSNYMTSTMH